MSSLFSCNVVAGCFCDVAADRLAGQPPPKAQKQKIGSQCNFFAIRDCLEIPDCGLRRKIPGNLLHCGSISLFGNGKESVIAKKLQNVGIFVFAAG